MLGKTTSVTYFGGVVGHVRSGANVTITKCNFDTYYYNAIGTTCAGGIVGLAEGKLTVKNCEVSIYSSYAIKGTFAGGVVGRSSKLGV